MVPNSSYDEDMQDELLPEFDIEDGPSHTYAMHPDMRSFVGITDDTDAVRQAVLKILGTERYEYEIYSWNYGVELQDLHGKSMPYVMSEVKERIRDALTADDRIKEVSDFKFQRLGKRALHCTFTVVTVQGDEFEAETEVNV